MQELKMRITSFLTIFWRNNQSLHINDIFPPIVHTNIYDGFSEEKNHIIIKKRSDWDDHNSYYVLENLDEIWSTLKKNRFISEKYLFSSFEKLVCLNAIYNLVKLNKSETPDINSIVEQSSKILRPFIRMAIGDNKYVLIPIILFKCYKQELRIKKLIEELPDMLITMPLNEDGFICFKEEMMLSYMAMHISQNPEWRLWLPEKYRLTK